MSYNVTFLCLAVFQVTELHKTYSAKVLYAQLAVPLAAIMDGFGKYWVIQMKNIKICNTHMNVWKHKADQKQNCFP